MVISIKSIKMFIILFWINIVCVQYVHASYTSNVTGIGIVILSQANDYHKKLFQIKENEIKKQAIHLDDFQVHIFNSYTIMEDQLGHWIIIPLIRKLSMYKEFQWLFFIEEVTGVNLEILFRVLRKYNSSEDNFVGYSLKDTEPTIIHHFEDSDALVYPHFSAGFFISSTLLQSSARRNIQIFGVRSPAALFAPKVPAPDEYEGDAYSFSIDPKYEFAKFIWDSGNGTKLQHDNQLCLSKHSYDCATWVEKEFPDCGFPVASDDLHVGVKTCQKFHGDRVTVVRNTWASETENLYIFSDKENKSIPTIKIPIENVAHGHCEKTLYIMKYFLEKDIHFKWLAVVDDDTIISIERLRKLLSCYNASETVAVGERYGYLELGRYGFDYLTGGSGMIFSLSTVKLLVKYCQCPTIDSPDDMIIGSCLKRLRIPVTHSPYFHQARPVDYSPDFLNPFKHVSFHKHWMIDPYSVYYEWLQEGTHGINLHTEL